MFNDHTTREERLNGLGSFNDDVRAAALLLVAVLWTLGFYLLANPPVW